MKTLIIIFISLISLNLFSMNGNSADLSGNNFSRMNARLSFGFAYSSSLENFTLIQADTLERIAIDRIPILLPMRTTITATGSTCGMLWGNVVYNLMFKVQSGFLTPSPLRVHSVTLTPGSYLGSVNISPGLIYTVGGSQIFTVAFASSLPAGATVGLTVYYSEGNGRQRSIALNYVLPVCNNCRCMGRMPEGITVNVNDGSVITPTPVSYGSGIGIFSDAPTNFKTNAIQCSPNCPSSIKWTIKDASGALITSGTNSGSPVITSSYFTINNPSTYVLEVEYFCGNVPCGKNKIKLNVRSGCRCGTWSDVSLTWHGPENNRVAGRTRCGDRLVLERGLKYSLSTQYTCPVPPRFCNVSYEWKITNSSSTVVYSGAFTGNANNTVLRIPHNMPNITFTTPGIYTLEIKVKCGDTECQPCRITLVVTERCHCREGLTINASYMINGQSHSVSVPCTTPAANIGPVPSNSAITLNYNSVCLPSLCAATYSWSVKRLSTGLPVVTAPSSPGSSTSFTFTPAANVNDSYEVTITPICGIANENCRPCKFIINTTSSPCPFISVNEGDDKICSSQGTDLTLTGWTGNGTNVTWYKSNSNTPASDPNNIITVSGINLTGTTINTGALLNNSTTCDMTTYYYQAKTTNPECISNPVLIRVYPPLPDITITGNTQLCSGDFLNLTSSIGAANDCNYGIKWYDSENNFIAAGSNISGLRLYSECSEGLKKTYTFKVVYCEGECNEKSKTVNVDVYSLPEVTSIAAEQDTICPLDATVLHATGACGDKIQWQMYNFTSNSWVDIGGATSVDFNTNKLEVSTLYRVVISNGPCTYTAISNTQWVIVQPKMSAEITYDPANRPCAPLVCPDITLIGAVNLMGYNLDFNTYFEWYNNGTVVPNSRNNPVLTTSTPGNYYIRITNSVSNNPDVSQRCGIFESNHISVSPLTVSIAGPNCVCIPGSFTYTANSNCSSVTYKWYLNGNLLPSITTATANVNIANDGDVLKVEITSTNGGCTAESSVTIHGCSGCQ